MAPSAPPPPPQPPTTPPSHHRASSFPSSTNAANQHHHPPPPRPFTRRSGDGGPHDTSKNHRQQPAAAAATAVHPSLIQPRVAVVLNVPTPWHPWLFALRLSSILPAVWWGLPSALWLLLTLLPGPEDGAAGASGPFDIGDVALTETALATIWCFACGYLSFFFTDCLMSRWLINYTPQATIVRLITINAVNAYVTSTVLYLTGGFNDPRLLLPGWIGIATTLTVCYHITHQKINIRKETSTSINVFSIASYITMVTLLAYMHAYQLEYPEMPLVTRGRVVWCETTRLWRQFQRAIEHAEL